MNDKMDDEDQNCLKIHGYVSSSEWENDDSDESKRKLDKVYKSFKPPPIQIDPEKHEIIVINNEMQNNNLPKLHLDNQLKKTRQKKRSKRAGDSKTSLLSENRTGCLELVPDLSVSNRFSALAVEDTIKNKEEDDNTEEKVGELLTEKQVSAINEDKGALADNESLDEEETDLFVTVKRKSKLKNTRHVLKGNQQRRK